MSSKDSGSSDDISASSTEIAISHNVRFWLILLFYVPSVICSFFVLYHFLIDRTLRQALHNHVIIILLLINLTVQLTSFPWILNYYRLEYVGPQTHSFCLTWLFIDEALYITTTLLFAWATFERHILIFHDRFVGTRYKVIFVHHLPILIILLYCISYNIIVVLVAPCEDKFYYTEVVCGSSPCYYETPLTAFWDVIVNDIIPTIVIIVCSVSLLLRVLYQKESNESSYSLANSPKDDDPIIVNFTSLSSYIHTRNANRICSSLWCSRTSWGTVYGICRFLCILWESSTTFCMCWINTSTSKKTLENISVLETTNAGDWAANIDLFASDSYFVITVVLFLKIK